MCEYCGCKTVPPIRQLMEEHTALLDQAVHVRHALIRQRWDLAEQLLNVFTHLVRTHVRREERGVFRAMRDSGEFLDEVEALEGEHAHLDRILETLAPGDRKGLHQRFDALVHELTDHIEREDLGIFPVAVVSLGARGWDTVQHAHEETPTFVPNPAG